MTDAIAEWFLGLARTDADAGEVLLGINDNVKLESLVTREREARRMKVDDSTMLVLE